MKKAREEINREGFTIMESIFTSQEVDELIGMIETADNSKPSFRKTSDLFAVRQFLKEVPGAVKCIFTGKMKDIISELFGREYFAVKSIYFDKPEGSNWFVSYHQDLTVSVDKKADLAGYGPWTVKLDQFAVQPPLNILEDNFTVRIHLDDTDEGNGALKVIPGSHGKGIYRPETIDWSKETEVICKVPKGGIMIMKPLLLHASGRSKNVRKRRVLHIEFSRNELPEGLNWSEKMVMPA